MSNATKEEPTKEPRVTADWSVPLPTEIPRPTYVPATMAFGITFFLWGFVTSPVLLAVGLLVMVTALVGWIGEMRRDD
jgi:hypothetical protein